MNKLDKNWKKQRLNKLLNNLKIAEIYRQEVAKHLDELNKRYNFYIDQPESRRDYRKLKEKEREYDRYISNCRHKIRKIKRERRTPIIILIVIAIIAIGFFSFFRNDLITGFVGYGVKEYSNQTTVSIDVYKEESGDIMNVDGINKNVTKGMNHYTYVGARGINEVRLFFMFNTSFIPDDADIINVTLHAYLEKKWVELGEGDVHVYDCDYGNTLEDGDFATSINYDYGILWTPASVEGDYYSIGINAGNISKTGMSHFCVFSTVPTTVPDGNDLWRNDYINLPYLELTYFTPSNTVIPTAPADGSKIDRDRVSPDPDTQTLTAELSDNSSGMSIIFYANLTNPDITGQTNINLGSNSTDANGVVVFNWNGTDSAGNKMYAGNYTWWPSAAGYTTNGTGFIYVYGGLNITWRNPNTNPDANYNEGDIVDIEVLLGSHGPESGAEVNTTYNAKVNATLESPSGTNYTVELSDP